MDDTFQELRRREEEDLAKVLAQKYNIPYLDLSKVTIELDTLKLIPEESARAYHIAVIQSVGNKLQVVLVNPENPGAKKVLEDLGQKKYETRLFLVSKSGIEKAFDRYKEIPRFEEIKTGVIEISAAKLSLYAQTVSSIAALRQTLEKLTKEKESKKASDTLEAILAGALAVEASDIHIEPGNESARLRLRLDGVLQDVADFPTALYQLILSRVKLVSEVKLNIHDKPQDGLFTRKTNNEDVEVRTSVLPGPYGESVVLRVLLPKAIATTMDDLGIQPELYHTIEKELKKPNGMIITTGPTGSGKTTTLYAFLKKIATSEIKVVTIEDPIEYHVPHITQTQVDPGKGYDFGNGLRSILRQDPDVILVGEIRDLETAGTAMHAALTGHLVFSTLHTNDAAGTIPRLIDLGVKPNIIAPAINMAIAQRLVRKLCARCKKTTAPTSEEQKIIETALAQMPKKYRTGAPSHFKIAKAVGCDACNHTGYKGRIGIFEGFLVDDAVERLIIKTPPEADIEETVEKQGMLTMYQDGILKVINAITSLEELQRVVSAQ